MIPPSGILITGTCRYPAVGHVIINTGTRRHPNIAVHSSHGVTSITGIFPDVQSITLPFFFDPEIIVRHDVKMTVFGCEFYFQFLSLVLRKDIYTTKSQPELIVEIPESSKIIISELI